ncbi:hypothetical protein ACLOJK_016133 [Asimina triloba]
MDLQNLASLLHQCSKIKSVRHGCSLHANIIKMGLQSCTFLSNHLLNMYAKCGYVNHARHVFDNMADRNLVSWSAMISGYDQADEPSMALALFSQMQVQPNEYIYASIINACASISALSGGKQVHAHSLKAGYESISFVSNSLISMYMSCRLCADAVTIFRTTSEPNSISYNAMIAGFAENEQFGKGIELFRLMHKQGVCPDRLTFMGVLGICTCLEDSQLGLELHCQAIKVDLHVSLFVGNMIVSMYSNFNLLEEAEKSFKAIEEKDVISWNTLITACSYCGDHAKALRVFGEMGRAKDRNLVTWNTIIAGFGNHGHGRRAVEIFEKMIASNMNPDSVTFISLLAACNHSGLVDEGFAYFDSMREIYGITPNIEHFSCLIDLLGRAGRLKEAEEYLKAYPLTDSDLIVWGSMLSACRLYGETLVGERMAKQLLELGPETSSPYVLLSNLYALDGRWDSVAESRKMLKGSGVKKEPGHSLIEVQGMVERFTVGDFSHSKIVSIKEVLGNLTWAARELQL